MGTASCLLVAVHLCHWKLLFHCHFVFRLYWLLLFPSLSHSIVLFGLCEFKAAHSEISSKRKVPALCTFGRIRYWYYVPDSRIHFRDSITSVAHRVLHGFLHGLACIGQYFLDLSNSDHAFKAFKVVVQTSASRERESRNRIEVLENAGESTLSFQYVE